MHRIPHLLRPYFQAPEGEGADRELRRNLHLVAIHGIFNAAALNMVGPFTAIFAMKIGATQLHVALLTSGPAVVSLLAMIPGALSIDRSDRKQRLTARFMLGHRVLYLALACVPFFPAPSRPTAFVALLALMNLPGAISNVAWQAFTSRVVPPEHRPATFAARNRLMSLVGTSVALLMGLFLDRVVFPVGYQIAFVSAFLAALVELAVFRTMREGAPPALPLAAPPAAPPAEPSTRRPDPPFAAALRVPFLAPWVRYGRSAAGGLRAILEQKRFVRYTLVSMLFYLTWQIPWPLYSWYHVRVLHANNLWVSLLSLMNTGGALAGYGFWTRYISRHGNLRALCLATLPIFMVSVVYAFATELYSIAVANLFVGVVFSGVNLALLNTLLEMTPDEQKTSYIAYFNTAITISSIVAPLIGVGLLRFMSFRPAFLVTAGIRLSGSAAYYALYKAEKREGRVPTGEASAG
jgi:predicted MFS family arabinose efflux permease